jgi:hypothetical protein
MTNEELIAAGKILCRAYSLGRGYSGDYADARADEVRHASEQWPQQAKFLQEMGYTIGGAATPIAGQMITAEALVRVATQLAENVKVTLEAVEKHPEPNKKLLAQWRFALNCFVGATHKRGLIPDLKDAGPGAY